MKKFGILVISIVLTAVSAYGQEWFFAWDATGDLSGTPTADGMQAFFQSSRASTECYWSIVPNGEGGYALRTVDNSPEDGLRWKGFGSRPEFYRGPANSFAMENVVPGREALTVAFRIRAESYDPSPSSSDKIKRLFNCEYETTIPNPHDDGYPFYTFRFEFGLQRDESDNIFLSDFRSEKIIGRLKTVGEPSEWHTFWFMAYVPPERDQANCIYRAWYDGMEVDWDDRIKGGWSDCEIGWDGESQTAQYDLDYLCYGYGQSQPGDLAIPTEQPLQVVTTVPQARSLADGVPLQISGLTITGVYEDPALGLKSLEERVTQSAILKKYTPKFAPDSDMRFYYAVDANGDGIKIAHNTGLSPTDSESNPVNLAVGDVVSVKGVKLTAEAEQQISAHEFIRTSQAGPLPTPQVVANRAIQSSYHTALREMTPSQLGDTKVTGTIVGLTRNTITDPSQNWTADQWKHATVVINPGPGHAQPRYYYVETNTSDTLTLCRRVLPHTAKLTQGGDYRLNILTEGVAAGETFYFNGGLPTGPRLDGNLITTRGVITAVNQFEKSFDIRDSSAEFDTTTLQDIWDTYLYPTTFVPPDGIRVFYSGVRPTVGTAVQVTGNVGAYRLKYRQYDAPTGRDEVHIDKVMPVIWANSWEIEPDPTATATATASDTATLLPLETITPTATITTTPVSTIPPAPLTSTNTPIGSEQPTNTPSNTEQPTSTSQPTETQINTLFPTNTTPAEFTATSTALPTLVEFTATPTGTETDYSQTPTRTPTSTRTLTSTRTITPTTTATFTPTETRTETDTPTASLTPSVTQTNTPTATGTPYPTYTETPQPTEESVWLFEFSLRWGEWGWLNTLELIQYLANRRFEPTPTPLPYDEDVEILEVGRFDNAGPKLVFSLIQPGTFTMGVSDSSSEPGQLVTIPQGFYLAQTETTQAFWQAFSGESIGNGWGNGPDYPVYGTNWSQVQAFIAQLNSATVAISNATVASGSYQFRLPSQAEWEFACRGKADNPNRNADFWFGSTPFGLADSCMFDTFLDRYMVWCGNDSDRCNPVATRQPNRYGLYDMHGNVNEWCQDEYAPGEPLSALPRDGSAWVPGLYDQRVIRGGAWTLSPGFAHSAYRDGQDANRGTRAVGFRLVLEVLPTGLDSD